MSRTPLAPMQSDIFRFVGQYERPDWPGLRLLPLPPLRLCLDILFGLRPQFVYSYSNTRVARSYRVSPKPSLCHIPLIAPDGIASDIPKSHVKSVYALPDATERRRSSSSGESAGRRGDDLTRATKSQSAMRPSSPIARIFARTRSRLGG